MSQNTAIFTSNRVLLQGNQEFTPATIECSKSTGKITAIHQERRGIDSYPGLNHSNFFDAGQLALLPGLLDFHVHCNDPGRTDWEGFATATQAAASGGFTTIVDMPLNSIPPTTTLENLNVKTRVAKPQAHVDIGFWGGAIPGNQDDLASMTGAGVKGFKCFLCPSGVDEFPCLDKQGVVKAMEKLEAAKSLFLFHAEMSSDGETSSNLAEEHSHQEYSTFLASRPDTMEKTAIDFILQSQRNFPELRTHIVHLSSSSALPNLREARGAGIDVSVETCFHYLCLDAESIGKGMTQFKCCPPIRAEDNREALWKALEAGDIDFVVSDHSPSTADLKEFETGDFMKAWGGISGLGLGSSLLWTEGRKRNLPPGRIIEWISAKPAKRINLSESKGSIQVGADCDLVVFDPEEQFQIEQSSLRFKNQFSAYVGRKLTGRVRKTFLRGELIFDLDQGRGFEGLPQKGRLLL